MTAVVAVFRNPNTGTTIRVTGANIGVVTAWGWTRLDDGPPGTPPDPFPQYLSDTELAAALTAKADLVSGKVPAAQLPPIPATPAAIGAQPAGSYATTVAGTVPDAQLPTRLQDTQLKAAFVPKWKPSTAYAAGDPVVNPSGQLVTANATFTSGTSYNAANWTVVAGGSAVDPTVIAGKADAVGPWTDIVRAAQFGYSHTAAVAGDSTSDNLSGAFEWPLLSLKLLSAQYPNVRMEHLQFDDTSRTFGTATVVNAGAATTGGTVADDGFSGTGNAVGSAADTVGTWQAGTGTVTKASGTATPAANSGVAFLSATQDAKSVLDMIVTTAGLTGGAQAYRVGVAYTNASLTGFGLQAILTIASPTSTTLTLRKYSNGGTLTTISSETLDLGLNNATAQAATFSIELNAGTVTVILTAGATTTTRTFTVTAAEYAGFGYFAGTASATTVGAVTYDRFRVITAVIPTPTVRIYNASVAGKNPDYLRIAGRLAAAFPVAMDSIYLSYGHNGWLTPGGPAGFVTDYKSTLDLVKAAQPGARLYIGSQNPEFAPNDASKVASHAARQALVPKLARDNGCSYVPVLEAFEASGTDNGLALVQGDGVHPTNPPTLAATDGYGSTLWARTVVGMPAPAASSGLTQTTADARYAQLSIGVPGVVTPLAAGAWYPAGPVMQHSNLTPPEANEQAVPFIAGRTTTLTGIGIQVATAGTAGAVIRLGVRADNGSAKPGTLLADAGTVDGTTTGVKTVTVSVPVTAGTRYWVTHTVQGAATTRPALVSLFNLSAPMFPAANATDSLANTNYGWRVSGITGALPAGMTPDNMLGSGAKTVISAAT